MNPSPSDHTPAERVGETSGKKVVVFLLVVGVAVGLSALIAQHLRGSGVEDLPPPRPGVTPAP